jgi:integrase
VATFKRGNAWYYEFVFAGRRYRRSAGKSSTQKDAKNLEAAHRLRLVQNKAATKLGTSGAYTFADAFERWLSGEGARFLLDKRFHSRLKTIKPFLNGVRLVDGIEAAEELRSALTARGLGDITINRHLADVRRVLNLAYKWGWLREKLADRIQLNRSRNRRRVILTPEQVAALARAAKNSEVGRAIELTAYTGLRRGELLGLVPANFDGDCLVLWADQTKDRDDRRIPLPKPLRHLLTGGPIALTEQQLRRGWQQARRDTGLKHVQFRDLRHSYLTWGAKAGIPASVLQQLAGHQSLAMTQWYIDVAHGKHENEVAKLARWALGKKKGVSKSPRKHPQSDAQPARKQA